MGAQNKLVLLSGFVITLGILQGTAAVGCSSKAYNPPFSSLVGCSYYKSIKQNSSLTPTQVVSLNCTFNSRLAPVYILIDLIPLMVYFPLLILFNFNLASGPAQSFIFFYQVLPAAIPLDQAPYATYTLMGGFISSLLVMQNPLTDLIFPRRLPYLGLQYW